MAATQLVGIYHNVRYLGDLKEFLPKEKIRGRTIALEISDYPLPSFYRNHGESTDNFWDPLAEHIFSNGGTVLPIDDGDLYIRALRWWNRIVEKQSKADKAGDWRSYNALESSKYYAGTFERDPHFIAKIEEEKPDYVVLGATHIKNISKSLPGSLVTYIPAYAAGAGPRFHSR